jgi:hypothetical protein
VIIINVKKSEILTMFDKKSKIILDTNMYIFNYEYITGKIPKYDCPEKTKRENVRLIFKYLEEKQIPVVVPKIIFNEINKKMIQFIYIYNKDIIFGKLNIIEDKDEIFEIENKSLAQKVFYESSTDLMIYIYCKDKKIQIIITDNTTDFYESEKRYKISINKSKIEIIIAGIADIYKAISEKNKV